MPPEADDTITLTNGQLGTETERQIEVPRRLGSVRLTQEIGRGGMGVVWLGRDEFLGRDVAVKFLLNIVTGTDDPGFVRFMDGARAATAARHASLTTIYHADMIQNTPYLVMEFVNGASLADVVRSSGPLSDTVCMAVLADVCDALGELHDRRIIHRDIKPGNVLIDLEGHVFLTDFGLACARPAEGNLEIVSVSGTPAYMAPEMFDGAVSERSDVYALGLMTYQMLTGERAFSGPLAQVRRQHMLKTLPIEPLEERGVPDALIELLERATNKDALFRYKTARHFYERLVEAFPTTRPTPADRRALAALVSQARGSEEIADQAVTSGSAGSSYYDTLAKRAAIKRGDSGSLPDLPTPSSLVAASDEEAIPVGETIPFNLNCLNCDYNLRGLSPNGQCPECGAPNTASLWRQRLVFAPRAWLSSLIMGVTLLLVSMSVDQLSPIIRTTVLQILMRNRSNEEFVQVAQPFMIGMQLFGFANLLLLGVATFFLTRIQKDLDVRPIQSLLVWLTRLAAVVCIASPLVSIAMMNVSGPQTALLLAMLSNVPKYFYYGAAISLLSVIISQVPLPLLERTLTYLARVFAGAGAVYLIGGLSLASLMTGSTIIHATATFLFVGLLLIGFVQLWRVRALLVLIRHRQRDLIPALAALAAVNQPPPDQRSEPTSL